jgi:hypothetical protein
MTEVLFCEREALKTTVTCVILFLQCHIYLILSKYPNEVDSPDTKKNLNPEQRGSCLYVKKKKLK